MDDFEAFRKKQKEKKASEKEAADGEKAFDAAKEQLGWVDGIGPAGHNNPKVKGFVLGRYKKKKVDVNELEKPKGFEKHRADKPEGEQQKPVDPAPKPKKFNKY